MLSGIRGQLADVGAIVAPAWSGDFIVLSERLDGAAGSLVHEVELCGGKVLGIVTANGGCDRTSTALPRYQVAGQSSVSRAEFAEFLSEPSSSLLSWLDEVDGGRHTTLISTNFLECTSIAGRPVVGARPAAWSAYEDKTRVDDLFRRLGIAVPPAVVVSSRAEQLLVALRTVSGPLGAVVALDSSTDFRGDSFGLSWVRADAGLAELDRLITWASAHAERVRVAQFLDGVPCSVLGMVAPGGVAVFDPIEIVTLRDVERHRLLFSGSSNFWRPPFGSAEDVRAAARRVGEALGSDASYSGFFSVDGLLTSDGFIATEINPRFASGLGLRVAAPTFPVYLFSRSLGGQPDLFAGLDVLGLESEIRGLVRRVPSFALRLPGDGVDGSCSGCADAPVLVGRVGVGYRSRCDGVALVSAEPVGPHRILGPVVAALGRELGWRGLTCYPPTN